MLKQKPKILINSINTFWKRKAIAKPQMDFYVEREILQIMNEEFN
jgi:hypothetical protein